MIEKLVNLANDLDSKGLREEADFIDSVIKNARSGSHSMGWPTEMWKHSSDVVKVGNTIKAIARATRAKSDNISKKCADMTAIGKLAYGLPTDGVLGDITYRRFRDDDFCYTVAEVVI